MCASFISKKHFSSFFRVLGCNIMLTKVSLNTQAIPRITIPHRLVRHIEKVKYKNLLKEGKSSATSPKYVKSQQNVVISCKRQKFNHYRNQTYSEFTPECLSSKGWKSKKSRGDYFTINPVSGNPYFDDTTSTFKDLHLSEAIVNALKDSNIIQPTIIQSKVIPLLNNGESVLCAAETGNGKTLCYLLPMIERVLKVNKMSRSSSGDDNDVYGDVRHRLNRPIAIVIAPSRELADQIYSMAKDLSTKLGFDVDVKCGGRRTQSILKEMEIKPLDILISTPGVLSKLLSNKFYNLTRLSMISFDEADTLFDDSFTDVVIRVIRKLKISTEKPAIINSNNTEEKVILSGGLQVAFVGATMPKGLQAKLNEVIDMEAVETVVTNNLHCILPHVTQKFVRLGPSQKIDHLVAALKSNLSRTPKPIPTIVFCNKPDTVKYLGHVLTSHNIDHVKLHADMSQSVREGRYEQFQSGDTNCLICTDLASRGLNTIRALHVINYDFPPFMSDYVHRVGRVGRLGSQHGSFVLSFVTRRWDVDLLWKIETSVRKRTELPNVNANIKRKLQGLHNLKASHFANQQNFDGSSDSNILF